MPDWLVFIVFAIAWTSVLVLLHETGHALAALALTDGDVSISMRGAGVLGGSVSYDPASLRHARGEAWIAAAGPAVTLFAATVLWLAWLGSGSNSPDAGRSGSMGRDAAFRDERVAAPLRGWSRRAGRHRRAGDLEGPDGCPARWDRARSAPARRARARCPPHVRGAAGADRGAGVRRGSAGRRGAGRHLRPGRPDAAQRRAEVAGRGSG